MYVLSSRSVVYAVSLLRVTGRHIVRDGNGNDKIDVRRAVVNTRSFERLLGGGIILRHQGVGNILQSQAVLNTSSL